MSRDERDTSTLVRHEPCPSCGSRDNLGRYSDGHGYCFGCGHYEPGDGETHEPRETRRKAMGLIDGEIKELPKRGIKLATAEKWNYRVGEKDGKAVQIANYYDADGRTVVAQKCRTKDKDFFVLGSLKDAAPLYGQWLWRDGGKMVVVTEGEIDALSVSQLQNNKWPVVSVPNGAQGAKKAISKAYEWLCQFETVVFMFDMDEPGREAAEACAEVLPPGKAKIARLPLKDANDMLTAGRGAEVIDAIWGAKEFRPDGVVSIGDVRDQALKPVEVGAAWPWQALTEATFGRRPGEVYALGAGTGVGKTDVFTQIIAHDALVLKVKCGVIYLEQPVVETARRIAGKVVGKRFHVPDGSWSQDELRSALDTLTSSGNVFLYDHFGQMDWETVESRIRYMAVGLGCRHIFLDHLTALAAGAEDERKVLEDVMARIAGLAQELGLVFHFISHLATPEGKPHEEGGRVMIRHFKGSRAIGFWSHFMFGLERDQQEEDEDKRSITTLRILKDRYTGQGTGKVIYLRYDQENGMLSVCSPDFADETKEKENADEPF